MARRIPPLNPLRVFDAVSRTGSLTAGAEELHVTQSAASRQIAVLETYLGIELFRRNRNGVTLTRAGQAYADDVVPAFLRIAEATERLLKESTQDALRVRTYTTVTAKWLIPRLAEFRRRHPRIVVRITNAVPDVDFARDNVDIAIQYGDGNWNGVISDLLFHDEIEPICAPDYVASLDVGGSAEKALATGRLLFSEFRRGDWTDWLAACKLADAAASTERMSFSSSVLSWQAAVDGLGMAMGQSPLLASDFAAGKLVRPFAKPLRRKRAYYVVRPRLQRSSTKVELFMEWLLETAAPFREPGAAP